MATSPDTKAPQKAGWSRWFLVPLLKGTLLTGAVIGMYFQPAGSHAFFNTTALERGAGTDRPIAQPFVLAFLRDNEPAGRTGRVIAVLADFKTCFGDLALQPVWRQKRKPWCFAQQAQNGHDRL